MNDFKYLDKLLTNKQALLDADWNELHSIQKKYPFSLIINQVLAKKHYLETGFLQSAYFNKTIALQNNPGFSYASMLNMRKKSVRRDKKVSDTVSKQEPIQNDKADVAIMNETTNTPADLYSGIKDEFTLWLAGKDKLIRKEIDVVAKGKPKEKIELKDE